ncbi:HopJ type III effector protein [Methyloparacoccus murrellii]
MSTTLQAFLERVKRGEPVEFQDTLAVIGEHYHYRPTAFGNGLGERSLRNEAGTNEGSCRIFAFARLNGLSEAQTLALFGAYYRDDVLPHPEGHDHRNIRHFMQDGWAGIHFEGEALKPR